MGKISTQAAVLPDIFQTRRNLTSSLISVEFAGTQAARRIDKISIPNLFRPLYYELREDEGSRHSQHHQDPAEDSLIYRSYEQKHRVNQGGALPTTTK